ncbi:hypothetical protein D3C85_1232110 [compost metagenome]
MENRLRRLRHGDDGVLPGVVAAVHRHAGTEDRHRRLLQGPDRLFRKRHALHHRSGRHADPGAGKHSQPRGEVPAAAGQGHHRYRSGRRHGRAGRKRAPRAVAARTAEQGRRKPADAEVQGSDPVRNHAGRPANPDHGRGKPPDVRFRFCSLEAVFRRHPAGHGRHHQGGAEQDQHQRPHRCQAVHRHR